MYIWQKKKAFAGLQNPLKLNTMFFEVLMHFFISFLKSVLLFSNMSYCCQKFKKNHIKKPFFRMLGLKIGHVSNCKLFTVTVQGVQDHFLGKEMAITHKPCTFPKIWFWTPCVL